MLSVIDNLSVESLCPYLPTLHAGSDNDLHNYCICPSHASNPICQCTTLSHPWLQHLISNAADSSKQLELVAYIRDKDNGPSSVEQLRTIDDYCLEYGYKIRHIFQDLARPFFGLQMALHKLRGLDGLIAIDLNRFVDETNDRLQVIRPFVHHYFCHTNKSLITIKEGIDVNIKAELPSAFELICRLKQQDNSLASMAG